MRTSRFLAVLVLPACAGVAALAAVPSHHAVAAPTAATAASSSTATAVRGRPVTAALRRPAKPAAVSHRRVPAHRPSPASRPRPRAVVATRRAPVPVLTAQQRLAAAVARTPGGGAGITWRLQADDGHWGTTDWYRDVVWISPLVPADRLPDVVLHEWSHVQSVRAYGGDVDQAVQAMSRVFGGSGLFGAERAADCMARLLGADWTHYTTCTNASWRAAAHRLLAGQRL